MLIESLDSNDGRSVTAQVASPTALLIAKLHKLGERRLSPHRLLDKDAHDVYRLLLETRTEEIAQGFSRLMQDDVAGLVTSSALPLLTELFADGPDALGSEMAGRAEQLVGDPAVVSQSVSVLAADVLTEVHRNEFGTNPNR